MYRQTPVLVSLLVMFLILQVIILYLQKTKGPLYIIPKIIRPKTYSYVREIIETEDLESEIIPYVNSHKIHRRNALYV